MPGLLKKLVAKQNARIGRKMGRVRGSSLAKHNKLKNPMR